MAKYYFSLEDRNVHTDVRAAELQDLDAARRESVLYLAALLKEKDQEFWAEQNWRLIAADERGLTLFRIEICVTDAPAVSR